jgi:hypothetical protein
MGDTDIKKQNNGAKITTSFSNTIAVLATLIAIFLGVEKIFAGRYITAADFSKRVTDVRIEMYKEFASRDEVRDMKKDLTDRLVKIDDLLRKHSFESE